MTACPFCGGKDIVRACLSEVHYADLCKRCGAKGPLVLYHEKAPEFSWNTRHTDPEESAPAEASELTKRVAWLEIELDHQIKRVSHIEAYLCGSDVRFKPASRG